MSGGFSLAAFLETHERVRESFLRHQEALLDRDVEAARRHLERHASLLCFHIQEEEIGLLPVYAERAGGIEGGGVELFTAEHRKLESFLREFQEALSGMRPSDHGLRRRILDLLDRQALYKHLLHHHDLRERNVLYPTLERVTTVAERRKMLAPQGRRRGGRRGV